MDNSFIFDISYAFDDKERKLARLTLNDVYVTGYILVGENDSKEYLFRMLLRKWLGV